MTRAAAAAAQAVREALQGQGSAAGPAGGGGERAAAAAAAAVRTALGAAPRPQPSSRSAPADPLSPLGSRPPPSTDRLNLALGRTHVRLGRLMACTARSSRPELDTPSGEVPAPGSPADRDDACETPAALVLGVIDVLQPWRPAKRLESAVKRLVLTGGRDNASVIPPDRYAARFEEFLRGVFVA